MGDRVEVFVLILRAFDLLAAARRRVRSLRAITQRVQLEPSEATRFALVRSSVGLQAGGQIDARSASLAVRVSRTAAYCEVGGEAGG